MYFAYGLFLASIVALFEYPLAKEAGEWVCHGFVQHGYVKGHIVYTLDLVTILQLLHEFRRSGILRAELPAGLPQFKRPCLVIIELLAGEMIICHVEEAGGRILVADHEAYEAVAALGKLNWVFRILPEEELPSRQRGRNDGYGLFSIPPSLLGVSPNLPAPHRSASVSRMLWIPQRLVDLNSAEINTLPRRYRQVYILVDGVRSVEKIAAMLSQPAQLVEEVLQEMQSTGAIILKE